MAGIRRYIGRMVGGWAMALIMSIVTALVKKAMRAAAAQNGARQPFQSPFQSRTVNTGTAPPAPPKPQAQVKQPYKQWAVQDAIYQGMRKSELIAAYGQPDDKARPTFDQEIWTYLKDGSNDNETPAMTVTMDKGIVTDWAEN